MKRRSFIATVLIAAGLRKAPEPSLPWWDMSSTPLPEENAPEELVSVMEWWQYEGNGRYTLFCRTVNGTTLPIGGMSDSAFPLNAGLTK